MHAYGSPTAGHARACKHICSSILQLMQGTTYTSLLNKPSHMLCMQCSVLDMLSCCM
jgi:hypothetical protein